VRRASAACRSAWISATTGVFEATPPFAIRKRCQSARFASADHTIAIGGEHPRQPLVADAEHDPHDRQQREQVAGVRVAADRDEPDDGHEHDQAEHGQAAPDDHGLTLRPGASPQRSAAGYGEADGGRDLDGGADEARPPGQPAGEHPAVPQPAEHVAVDVEVDECIEVRALHDWHAARALEVAVAEEGAVEVLVAQVETAAGECRGRHGAGAEQQRRSPLPSAEARQGDRRGQCEEARRPCQRGERRRREEQHHQPPRRPAPEDQHPHHQQPGRAGHADRVVVDQRRLVRHGGRQGDHGCGHHRDALAAGQHEAGQHRGADHGRDREQEARRPRGPEADDRAVRPDADLQRHGDDRVQQRRVVGREDRQLRAHVRDHAAHVRLVQLRQMAVGDAQGVRRRATTRRGAASAAP